VPSLVCEEPSILASSAAATDPSAEYARELHEQATLDAREKEEIERAMELVRPPDVAGYQRHYDPNMRGLDLATCTAATAIGSIVTYPLPVPHRHRMRNPYQPEIQAVSVTFLDPAMQERVNHEILDFLFLDHDRYASWATFNENSFYRNKCTADRVRSHLLVVRCDVIEGGGFYDRHGIEAFNFLTCGDRLYDVYIGNLCPEDECDWDEVSKVIWAYHAKKYGAQVSEDIRYPNCTEEKEERNKSWYACLSGYRFGRSGVFFGLTLPETEHEFREVFVPHSALLGAFGHAKLFQQIVHMPL